MLPIRHFEPFFSKYFHHHNFSLGPAAFIAALLVGFRKEVTTVKSTSEPNLSSYSPCIIRLQFLTVTTTSSHSYK
ncbi:MAG: hypothetical protein WCA39_16570 [Nitrososphaeraceae archaeon]